LIRRDILPATERDGRHHIRRDDLIDLMRRDQRELERNDETDASQDFGLMGKRTDE
jgi:hypothetical protein